MSKNHIYITVPPLFIYLFYKNTKQNFYELSCYFLNIITYKVVSQHRIFDIVVKPCDRLDMHPGVDSSVENEWMDRKSVMNKH